MKTYIRNMVGMNSDTIITLHYHIVMHGLTLANKSVRIYITVYDEFVLSCRIFSEGQK